jgi:hypothetical protein
MWVKRFLVLVVLLAVFDDTACAALRAMLASPVGPSANGGN